MGPIFFFLECYFVFYMFILVSSNMIAPLNIEEYNESFIFCFCCRMVMLVLCCHVMMLNLAMTRRMTPFRQGKGREALKNESMNFCRFTFVCVFIGLGNK